MSLVRVYILGTVSSMDAMAEQPWQRASTETIPIILPCPEQPPCTIMLDTIILISCFNMLHRFNFNTPERNSLYVLKSKSHQLLVKVPCPQRTSPTVVKTCKRLQLRGMARGPSTSPTLIATTPKNKLNIVLEVRAPLNHPPRRCHRFLLFQSRIFYSKHTLQI